MATEIAGKHGMTTDKHGYDLADDATHEDIQEAVGKIIEDRKGEQAKDKTDAQRLAEDPENTSVATDDVPGADDDTAETGDETGDSEGQAQDWLDDDLKAEVAAFGIDEKELADFTSREELERALRIFDKSALEAGRKVMAKGKGEESQGKETKPVPKSEPKEGQYEIGLNKDTWPEDEDMVVELTRLRDHYEARFSTLEARFEARFAEADARAEEQHIDAVIDSLGHADLFGKTGKENSKQLERRQDLAVAAKAQQIGLAQMGREVDLDESLLNRVARMVFAEELGKKDLKARTRKMSTQANGHMGSRGAKAPDPKESRHEKAQRLYDELDDK